MSFYSGQSRTTRDSCAAIEKNARSRRHTLIEASLVISTGSSKHYSQQNSRKPRK